MLKIDNFTFGWDEKTLLENVSLELKPSDIVRLVGENGVGKTTLLHLIAGLIPHFSKGEIFRGDIYFNEKSVAKNPPRCFFPKIALIPSSHIELFLLNENLNQELIFTASILKMTTAELGIRIESFSSFFTEINEIRNINFLNLSGRQKALALTAIYFIQGAELFLFDDVFSFLIKHEAGSWKKFIAYLADQGKSVILIDNQTSINSKLWKMKNKTVLA
ncbi:hypothetical protein B6I21_06220 [candidate division KSB1 bacterium 4572_119]|nr:MAG: hypothetical protein B6I21_06220 [candidate division KSB1 bacterium 4572_119]